MPKSLDLVMLLLTSTEGQTDYFTPCRVIIRVMQSSMGRVITHSNVCSHHPEILSENLKTCMHEIIIGFDIKFCDGFRPDDVLQMSITGMLLCLKQFTEQYK